MRVGFLTHAGASIYHFRLPIIKALIARGDEVFVIVPQDEYTEKLKALNLNIVLMIWLNFIFFILKIAPYLMLSLF